MSDEQTMPEVMTRKWYPTLATRMAGDSSVAAMVDCEQRYNQEAYVTYADHLATIATLTAERDALQAKVDTIINYINSEETNEATGFWLKMLLGYEQAAAQEQDDDK